MKRFLMTVLLAFMAVSVGMSAAEAKRLGGGGSFGKRAPTFSRQATPTQPSQASNATRQNSGQQGVPPRSSPWKGILGGALLGLGLGALLSHFGLGGAMASFISTVLMIALLAMAAMFIIRMLRRKSMDNNSPRPAYAHGNGSSGFTPRIGSGLENPQPATLQGSAYSSGSDAPGQADGVPPGFDTPGFLRHAKTYFIRLQAAWDRADVNDIREFSTPEMFAELRMQLQERGASPNHTDVVSLDADLLGIETVGDEYLASVKFSGMIKEAEHAAAEPFTEIWNLSKPVAGQGGWILAGIQQHS